MTLLRRRTAALEIHVVCLNNPHGVYQQLVRYMVFLKVSINVLTNRMQADDVLVVGFGDDCVDWIWRRHMQQSTSRRLWFKTTISFKATFSDASTD